MNKRQIEEIKKSASELDAFKLKRKMAGINLLKGITIGGLGLLSWTFTMLLTIVIATDIDAGIEAFSEVNGLLYQLYTILVGISLFIFLIDYIIKKKKNSINKIVVEQPSNYKDK